LIKRPGTTKNIGNPSDDLVETFEYDFSYENTQLTLEDMAVNASIFFLDNIIAAATRYFEKRDKA
jgi:hypothetical protein